MNCRCNSCHTHVDKTQCKETPQLVAPSPVPFPFPFPFDTVILWYSLLQISQLVLLHAYVALQIAY